MTLHGPTDTDQNTAEPEHYVESFQQRHFDEIVEIWCPTRDETKAIVERHYVEFCPMCGNQISGWCDQ